MDRFGGDRFGRRDFGRDRSFAPVKVGDELDVKIEAVGGKGDGIAKKNGFVLFVPGVKEGDEVRIRVSKVLKKVGFAEVVGPGKAKDATAEEPKAEESEESEEAEEDYSGEDSEDFGEGDEDSGDETDEGSGDEDSGEEEKLKKFTDEEQ